MAEIKKRHGTALTAKERLNLNVFTVDVFKSREIARGARNIGQIPASFVYILRCFSILEGHGLRLDRRYRIVEDCYPYLASWALRAEASQVPLIRSVLYGKSAVLDVQQVLALLKGLSQLQERSKGSVAHDLRATLRRCFCE